MLHSSVLELILQSIGEGIVVADRDGKFLFWNAAAEQLVGVGPQAVGPEEWSQVYGCFLPDGVTPYPPEQLPLVRAMRGESTDNVEMFLRNRDVPDGVRLSVTARPLRDENQRLVGGVIVFRDISEQKRAEERLHAMIEASPDGNLLVGEDGRIVFTNTEAEEMFGYTREELVGQLVEILVPEPFRKSHRQQCRSFIEENRSRRVGRHHDFRGRRKDGSEFPVEVGLQPIQLQDGTYNITTVRDVTERRQLQHEFAVAREIQQALLPVQPPAIPGFDIAGISRPAESTGGDFFDFIHFDDSQWGVVVGDVSGHGFGPAILTASTLSYLRALAKSQPDLCTVLQTINELLFQDTAVGRFVTLVIARIDPLARTLTYVSAGHIDGFILDATGAVKQRLSSTGVPLGLIPNARTTMSPVTTVASGDLVLLLSDGFPETMNAEDQLFGVDRILECVRSHRQQEAGEILAALYDAVSTFRAGQRQVDDLTAVLVKVAP